MEEDDEGSLRNRRQAELEKRAEARKADEQLKGALRMALDEAAYGRIMNVAAGNRELYFMAAKQALMASKRIGRRLADRELLALLAAIKEQTSRETRITFHKK